MKTYVQALGNIEDNRPCHYRGSGHHLDVVILRGQTARAFCVNQTNHDVGLRIFHQRTAVQSAARNETHHRTDDISQGAGGEGGRESDRRENEKET